MEEEKIRSHGVLGGGGGLCPIPGTMAPWHRSPLRAGLQPVHLPPGRVEDNPLHNRDHP